LASSRSESGRCRGDRGAAERRTTGPSRATLTGVDGRTVLARGVVASTPRELRPSTTRRYQWYVENYSASAIGAHRLAGLRAEHLDRMYNELLAHGGRDDGALSAKTVYDVHVVMRSSLRFAVDRHLVDHNVAADARPPRISTRSRPSPEIWTAQQLAAFLAHTAHLQLYPTIHLAATTEMRRGEIAGLRWGRLASRLRGVSAARRNVLNPADKSDQRRQVHARINSKEEHMSGFITKSFESPDGRAGMEVVRVHQASRRDRVVPGAPRRRDRVRGDAYRP
jgi:integrase